MKNQQNFAHVAKSEKNAKFRNFQLDNLVDFEKCRKTRIYLQRSVPIQPKTSKFFPKIGNYPTGPLPLSAFSSSSRAWMTVLTPRRTCAPKIGTFLQWPRTIPTRPHIGSDSLFLSRPNFKSETLNHTHDIPESIPRRVRRTLMYQCIQIAMPVIIPS